MSNAELSEEPQLDATKIVSVLIRHDVRFVLIGAFAAIVQGAPIAATRDLDFTPDESADNLASLSTALKELDARIRTDSLAGGIPFDHDGDSLRRAAIWNLICPAGEFDIAFRPSGFEGGYEELLVRAHRIFIGGLELDVADLSDIIRSKETAGRPKDLRVLPALYRHHASLRSDSPEPKASGDRRRPQSGG